ncbi:Methionine aminopeptidase [Nostocoides japonicum T1-X7]|uniref:Methionine aminopeptidase n=1 Tax=Nostocoides japonicum T1-X7 TaxID=1194083 RepID=A0A077LXV7_9MICO|nr:type I methionyl aminopeptidase [Tetrasphaera japonica]CCH77717.1 Methionine aminopeptidase [Tetrasphaera japonica T1-X7]
MIEILTPAEAQAARPAGRFVAHALSTLLERVRPGTNLLEIDAWTAALIAERGGTSCYVDYAPPFGRGPFGRTICTSVNDAVLHGLPHDYTLRDGDLLSLDLAVTVDGWVADSAVSVVVGTSSRDGDQRMIDTTQAALAAGIAAARASAHVGDISAAVGEVLTGAGYPVNTQFGGHGVGRTMHQDPHVPNSGRRGRGVRLRPGMLLAIEPWVMEDTDRLVVDPDGWTLRSATGSRTAHSEHTILITDGDPVVLTARDTGVGSPT